MDPFQLLEEAGNVPPADDTTIEAAPICCSPPHSKKAAS